MVTYSNSDYATANFILDDPELVALCSYVINRTSNKDDARDILKLTFDEIGVRSAYDGFPITKKGIRLALTRL